MTHRKNISLRKRLVNLSLSLIIPLMLMVITLMAVIQNFRASYSQCVSNIAKANTYSVSFEKDMNYVVYRVVIGSASLDELKKGDILEGKDIRYATVIKNPYGMIEQARKDFAELEKVTTNSNGVFQIRGILSCLNTLENVLGKIENNMTESQYYSKNMAMWENDVHGVTSLIQNYVQKYISYEALILEELKGKIDKQTKHVIIGSICLLIGIIICVLFLIKNITRSVTEPISALCEMTKQLGKGNFSSGPQIESDDEIQILVKRFNEMKNHIVRLLEDVKTEQMKLKDMELKLLQEQINPHFLYNTLDTIIWLAEDGQSKEVVNMTTSLSEFFRTVLNGGEDYITIREEEHHIHSYLDIQRFRYQDIMDYKIEIDYSLYDIKILKLMLQPLVENALYHGIKNKREKGMILIKGYESEGNIIFEVKDDGIGMTEEELNILNMKLKEKIVSSRKGFGLINVQERIQMNYGLEYGLFFESEKNLGTKVIVKIPKENTRISKENPLFYKS